MPAARVFLQPEISGFAAIRVALAMLFMGYENEFIFKTHHITKQSYDNSMAFYTLHPEILNEIYEEVINELSKKQSEAERK